MNNSHHQNNGLSGGGGQYNIAAPQDLFMDNYGKDSIC